MNRDIFSGSRFKLTFSLILLILSVLFYLLLSKTFFSTEQAVIDVIITHACLYLTCYIISKILQSYIPQDSKRIIVLAWAFAFTVLWQSLSYGGLRLSLGISYFNLQLDYVHMFLRFIYGFQFITAFSFYTTLWLSQERKAEIDKRKLEAEQISKTAELYKLHQQFQPHFLFNSLNSINALIKINSTQARSMVQNLSDFLRFTLSKNDYKTIELQEEIKYINLYLEIEKIRFGNRLQTQFNIDEICKTMQVPAMILQPVLENAIKHGLYDTLEEVVIRITTKVENNLLLVSISNPYDPETNANVIGTGFGLNSIHRRLYLLYNRNDLLQIQKQNNIFTTLITIPQINEN